MSTRTIKLKLLTKLKLETIETSARTFGEFKAEITELDIDWTSSKLIDRASKASFDLDEAVLPAVDAVMFVMPTKSKAGADLPYKVVKSYIKDFKAMGGNVPFNYTQATTKQLNKFWNSIESQEETVDEIVEEMDLDQNTITLSPGVYKIIVKEDSPVVVNYIDETTLEDVEAEADSIKSKL